MAMEVVNVGIIGLGFMGRMHYGVYKDHAGASVAAIADHREARRSGYWQDIGGNIGQKTGQVEDLAGINTYARPEDLIADPRVELVDICLPTDLHSRFAIAALQAGKHVLLEKPMARNSTQARAIVTAATKAKGRFMVGHCIRFWPDYQVAYKLIRGRKYGRVREAFFRRVSPPPTFGDKNWFMKPLRSGAAQLDLHIHDLDFMLYLLGKPKKVYARGSKGPTRGADAAHAIFEYASGAHVTVIGSWAYHGDFPFNMEFCIRCDRATMVYNLAAGIPLTVYTHDGQKIQPQLPQGDGYSRQIDYFLTCIKQKVNPRIVTAKSSYETIKLVETELKSITTNRAVNIR